MSKARPPSQLRIKVTCSTNHERQMRSTQRNSCTLIFLSNSRFDHKTVRRLLSTPQSPPQIIICRHVVGLNAIKGKPDANRPRLTIGFIRANMVDANLLSFDSPRQVPPVNYSRRRDVTKPSLHTAACMTARSTTAVAASFRGPATSISNA